MSTRSPKVALALAALGVAPASAQPFVQPEAVEDPPLTIDPKPAPRTPRAPTPQPAQPERTTPNIQVITLGPDGRPVQPKDDEPRLYYPSDDADLGPQHTGLTPELHTVRTGDTLWDISWYYFNDPWQWPKVWSYNAQISNPHWIYPGDLVRLLPRGMYVAPVAGDPDGDPDGGAPQVLPGPTRRSSLALRDVSFVDKDDLDEAVRIDGSPEEKELLASGDAVYLTYPNDKPPQVGQRYSIYDIERQVRHEGKPVGAYVRILGELEVTSVKKDRRAQAVIVDTRREIERGFRVGPLVRELQTVPPVAPAVDVQGSILAMLTRDQLIGESEIVFVNLGEESGLEVGNRLYVVRRGDAIPTYGDIVRTGQDDRRFPARALGEVAIVDVGKKVSMAIVTLSIREMGVGDIVMMRKATDGATE